jgi:hypothetical protein
LTSEDLLLFAEDSLTAPTDMARTSHAHGAQRVDAVGREASLNAAYGNHRTYSHQSFLTIFVEINYP